MKSDPAANMSIFERFQVEDARIRRETEQIEKEMEKKRGEWKAKVAEIKGRRVRATAEREKLTMQYDQIEAEVLADERQRAEAKSVRKADVEAGRASLKEFYASGQTDASLAAEIRRTSDAKLADIMQLVRAKALEVLRLEVDEAEAEQNLSQLRMYGPHAMLERMKAQVKALEAVLTTNLSGYMPTWMDLDTKRQSLARGTGKGLKSERWYELDLAAVKRLRLNPGIPEDEIPTLLKIVAEMETQPGFKVDLLYDPMHGKPKLSIAIWRRPDKKAEAS